MDVSKQRLGLLLRTDREFRKDFVQFLFEYDGIGKKFPSSLIDKIHKKFPQLANRSTIEEELKKIINEMIPLIRVMKLTDYMKDFWTDRFRNYLGHLESPLTLSSLEVFDRLTDRERSVVEKLTITEIDFLSNLTPGGMNVVSKITYISEIEKTFLLSLTNAEIAIVLKLQYERLRLISRMDATSRNQFLRNQQNEPIEFQNLRTDEGRWLITGRANLAPNELSVVANMIDRFGPVIKTLDLKNMDGLLKDINDLTDNDLATIKLSTKEDLDIMKNLSVHELEVLGQLDENVLKLAGSLSKLELEELLILPEGTFAELSSENFRMKFMSLIRYFPDGEALSPNIVPLADTENTLLGLLKQSQKIILARIYKLPTRAVKIFFDSEPERLRSLVATLKVLDSPEFELTRAERFLLDRLKQLSAEDRHDIVWTTDEEWESLDELRHLKLSKRGVQVLRAMIPLNREQLNFIAKISKYGLAVLAGNNRLTPRTINLLMKLENEESQRFLTNMNLLDRFEIVYATKTLVAKYNLTPDGESLLREIGDLNSREMWWARQTDYRLLEHLNKNRLTVFFNLFDSILTMEKSVWKVWNLMDELGLESEEFATKVSKVEPKLLANLIIVEKPKAKRHLHFLDPRFYMELLKLSITDNFDENFTNQICQEIRWKGFPVYVLSKVYDYSTVEEIRLFEWLLTNYSELARAILYDRLHGKNRLNLNKIFQSRGLHEELKKFGYDLAQSISLQVDDIDWMKRIFNSTECLEFLRSEVYEETTKIPYLLEQSRLGHDIFSIYKTNKIKFSAILVYFDRWTVGGLFENLSGTEILEFFSQISGREFLRMSLKNGRTELLELFRERLDVDTLKGILRFNDYLMVKSVFNKIKTIERVEDLAKTLRLIFDIDSTIPRNYCIDFISAAKKIVQPNEMISIERHLNGACGEEKPENTICIDSFDRGETYSTETTNINIAFYDKLLEYVETPLDSFEKKLRNVESLDPKIRHVMRIFEEDWKNKDLLDQREIKREIRRSANIAGFKFVLSLMDEANWLGFEETKLWMVPEIGEKIPETITRFAFEELTNLYVSGTCLFVAMDVPVVASKIAGFRETSTVLGPGYNPQPVAVIDEQGLWERLLKLALMKNHIESVQDFPFDDFRFEIFTDRMKQLPGDKGVLEEYIARIVDLFKERYDRIGMSLPRWIVQETVNGDSVSISPARLIFDRRAVVRNPFDGTILESGLLSGRFDDFRLVCGPGANATEVQRSPRTSNSRTSTLRYRLPGTSSDQCQNMVLYETTNPTQTNKMILYVPQDYLNWESRNDNLDLIFLGKDLTIVDSGTTLSTNNYAFKEDLSNCKIWKSGLNVFRTTKNQFLCDLNGTDNGQSNVLVVRQDFIDSENILSVIGTTGKNKLTISHAKFVDGLSGNDNIVAGNSTVVQGYYGDTVTGGATVLLPGTIDEIETIKITPSSFLISQKNGTFLEIDKNCQPITTNDYFLVPIEIEDNLVRGLRLHKITQIDLTLAEQLAETRNMRNPNFKLIKHVSSINYDIVLTEMNRNVFLMTINEHYYYLEGPRDRRNLYIFQVTSGEIVISRGNGILNFESLKIGLEDLIVAKRDDGGIDIVRNDLRVTLLPDYNNIAITFDGKSYYDLRDGKFWLDRCSRPYEVRGKISIRISELDGHYNCLRFRSDKVHFVGNANDLLLVSGRGAILLLDYYKMNLDLSLKLNSETLSVDEFKARARNPGTVKFYRVGGRKMRIYHNLPENKYNVGVMDLSEWAMNECNVGIVDDSLLISHKENPLVTVENWRTQPRAREIVFSFGESEFLNTECIVSNCTPTAVVEDFQRYNSERFKRNVGPDCATDNSTLFYLLFQDFLNRNYPIPRERILDAGEILAMAWNATRSFEEALEKTAKKFRISVGEVDFYEIYQSVGRFLREERGSDVMKEFREIAGRICLGDQRFLNTLKGFLDEISIY